MDFSGNYVNNDLRNSDASIYYANDLQTRRLRLVSDIMEDYQTNIRQMIGLLTLEMGRNPTATLSEEHADNILRQNETMRDPVQSQSSQEHLRNNPVLNSVRQTTQTNRLIPSGTRRGIIYTQYIDPFINQDASTFELQYNDNIERGINNEQIQTFTQIVQYDASMSEMRCPITWDLFDNSHNILKINRCGHMFSENALISWFQSHNRCPVCRARVTETSSIQENTNNATRTNTMNEDNTTLYTNAINRILSRYLYNTTNTINSDYDYSENDATFNDLTEFYASLIGTQNINRL